MNVDHFIHHYGYWALLVGALIEGEAFCMAAGVFAHRGVLTIPGVMLVATLGTWFAGQLWFCVGRVCGKRIIERSPDRTARVERMRVWLGKGDALVYAGFHFVFGFRIITPLALGAMRAPIWRYSIFNAAGSLVWAVVFTLAGYYGGRGAKSAFAHIRDNEGFLAAVILIIAGCVWLAVRLHQRSRMGTLPDESDDDMPNPT